MGGICFLVDDKMYTGVVYDMFLGRTGRPMKGYVLWNRKAPATAKSLKIGFNFA